MLAQPVELFHQGRDSHVKAQRLHALRDTRNQAMAPPLSFGDHHGIARLRTMAAGHQLPHAADEACHTAYASIREITALLPRTHEEHVHAEDVGTMRSNVVVR